MTSIAMMPMESIAMALTRATRRRRVTGLERRADGEIERQALEPGGRLERDERRRAGSNRAVHLFALLVWVTGLCSRDDGTGVVRADAVEGRNAAGIRTAIGVVRDTRRPLVWIVADVH